ncbi:hypothetical protein [Ureibacillus acetophenoni]|uniref:Uncharacterized protein n=1 Tax=Ureibacillus acetophenoni TaxID=614649 RepID=A0A285UFB8_9BACL|nr:hypothetical protein [Ureibacillus acetophenoni]SOC40509.1 hypothetical protein SAMN05877842_10840 [Ureibacillus acetophenoni]
MLRKSPSFYSFSFIFLIFSIVLIVGCGDQSLPLNPSKITNLNEESSDESMEKPSEQSPVNDVKQSSNRKQETQQLDNKKVEEKSENNGIFGTWYIWIPGSATNYYDKDTNEYATHEFTPGADAGQIILNENGTYQMSYRLWEDRTVRGKWYLSNSGEINGEQGEAIILSNGSGGTDWAIAPSQDGNSLRLLQDSGTVWNDGSSLWLFDSELYR